MSESFDPRMPRQKRREVIMLLLLESSGRIICLVKLRLLPLPPDMVQPSPCRTASAAIVLVGHELRDRGCLGGARRGLCQLPQQGKLVSGVSWEIGVAVCRAGKQLAKLGRSSSSCREAASVQSVGTPLSRKQRRTMYTDLDRR